MKVDESTSDTELATRFNRADPLAFEEIYQRYWAKLYLHARNLLRDDEKAKDAVQDTFTTLFQKMGAFELKTTLKAFLYAAVRNQVIDLIRKEKVAINYIRYLENYDPGAESTDELIREKELAEKIEAAIQSLPPKMRRVFELSRKHYLKVHEIAEQTDVAEGTIKKQLQTALKILRNKLTSLLLVQLMGFILWLNSFQ